INSCNQPSLYEFPIGANGDPRSKIRDFAHRIATINPNPGAILMFKFCYVDVQGKTDVAALLCEYLTEIDALRSKYPDCTIMHVTMPLTAPDPLPMRIAKRLLGRDSQRTLNIKRNEYNALLRKAYANRDTAMEVLFDLAAAESTRNDGSQSYFLL